MIQYTEEEMLDLLWHLNFYEEVWGDGLPKYINRSFRDHRELLNPEKYRFLFANIFMGTESPSEIRVRDLINIIQYKSFDAGFLSRCLVSYRDETKESINNFIHVIRRTPLEEIPLYISSFQEIASWRLRIGK